MLDKKKKKKGHNLRLIERRLQDRSSRVTRRNVYKDVYKKKILIGKLYYEVVYPWRKNRRDLLVIEEEAMTMLGGHGSPGEEKFSKGWERGYSFPSPR